MKVISARGIVIKDDKVLLIFRKNKGRTYYAIPGGKQEANETLEETAIREVFEETSINVTIIKYLGKFKHVGKNKEQNLYRCKYISGKAKLGESDELEKSKNDSEYEHEPVWISLSEISKLTVMPDPTQEFFKDYIKQERKNPKKFNWFKVIAN